LSNTEYNTLNERTAPKPRLFGPIAIETIERRARLWKPGTLTVSRCYLRNQIMPVFGERPVAAITSGEVSRWFPALPATPATPQPPANRRVSARPKGAGGSSRRPPRRGSGGARRTRAADERRPRACARGNPNPRHL